MISRHDSCKFSTIACANIQFCRALENIPVGMQRPHSIGVTERERRPSSVLKLA